MIIKRSPSITLCVMPGYSVGVDAGLIGGDELGRVAGGSGLER